LTDSYRFRDLAVNDENPPAPGSGLTAAVLADLRTVDQFAGSGCLSCP